MRKPGLITRLFSMMFVLLGLTSSNVLPSCSSSQIARAANQFGLPKLTAQSASGLMSNGKIAFARGTQDSYLGIFTMNPDGSDMTHLTSGDDIEPAWSPDGAQIAFTRFYGATQGEVFLMNADGSNQRRLTANSNDRYPTWSPDGTKIAFSRFSRVWLLMIMNADGSSQTAIPGSDFQYQPAWSPDGSKLAVWGRFGDIYLINIDGTNPTQITQVAGPNDTDADPAWSPDGSKLAFTREINCDLNDCESHQIWVVNADGSNPTKLRDDDYYFHPAWSPDGTKIVFNNYGDFPHLGDLFVMNADGSGFENISNTSDVQEFTPSWQPVPFTPPPGGNPIDDAQFFVRQHYLDFLNREPDPDGLAFWTDQITQCGSDVSCVETKRINDSAAFYLSIEFQQTGYLVYRIYEASYGDIPGTPVPVRLSEFLSDTQEIGQGVVVNQTGWEQSLENNKQKFMADFVQRSRFSAAFPTSMTPAQFVDTLFANAGVAPSDSDRTAAVNEFGSASTTRDPAARARALRRVAENSILVQQEFNRAFVLMQYFGYLRRNPNDAPDSNFDGYNSWLDKLSTFNGDFAKAEMVKAFLVSAEYRRRFGQ